MSLSAALFLIRHHNIRVDKMERFLKKSIMLLVVVAFMVVGYFFLEARYTIISKSSEGIIQPTNNDYNKNEKADFQRKNEDEVSVADKENIRSEAQTNNQLEKPKNSLNMQVDAGINLNKIRQIKDYTDIFENQEVDSEWAHNQNEAIIEIFESDIAKNMQVLLQSSECKSSICKVELVNYDNTKESISVMGLMDVIYTRDWAYGFETQFIPNKEDSNYLTLFLINEENN